MKGKRKVVKSLLGRVKAKFNVTAAEIEDNDLWQRAGIGLAMVGNDRRFINSALDKVLDFIEREADGDLIDSTMEIMTIFSE